MGVNEPANAILRTADPMAELRWNSLLELQVATYLPYELHFLFTSEGWNRARHVLDAGCGNGYFLSQIRRYFPEKVYTGLDVSGELIAAARQSPSLDGVEIVHGDFFAYEPLQPFDIVVMRLIVQHMIGMKEILQQLERLLRVGGSVVIIEPEPRLFFNYPATPVFGRLLEAYSESMRRKGINRAALAGLGEEIAQQAGWALRQDRVMLAPFTGPFRNTALAQIFSLWIDLFERSGALNFDFEAARSEILQWSQLEVSFSQVGVRILEAQRHV